jgi:phosphoribosylanthranilate isomerase
VRVKICGVTNRADAETAIELGADALGFNFYEDSKRFIDFRAEAEWISSLPPFVTRVAVVVSPSLEQAREISALPWIDMLQLHGGESPQFCAEFAKTGMPFIKAIALRDEAAAANTAEFCTRNILLDAFVPGQFGGTGHTVDFALAEKFSAQNPGVALLLSGGLTAENVAEAVRRVRPFAVDVASGVEREPRKKDRGLMRAFIEAAQSA